ncbi:LLM class flavin-dependent oxidoreductase [Burkholderia sp. WAC0059]|uniref:LLM class flavin-dependent oxidoreductase n=1 Tax=Burkholderia sp. WAC0059 TaxID=2066022 RepID=UPI000C7F0E1F|nr:LLM class flavin-dependent oxidoreductase [Burkholderia sp. WAC0059]PLZ03703.1 LLM class flavin-dependent oxidoreductase [Burkholderia sp. WAC0059]
MSRTPDDDLPPDSPLARAFGQPLMLGLFLPVYDGGWSPSAAPRTTTWTYPYNAALARRAEELGFDLLFGPAEWVGKGGYGGKIRFRENSIDPFITTAALASATQRILLISTVHVLYGGWHPLLLARFGATLDHISQGRWGINVVTGHSVREAAMFGQTRAEHDLRYDMADEFVTIMKALWRREENLTFDGRFWKLESAFVSPAPTFGRPVLVSATGSPAGFGYAARHADIVFVTSPAGAQIDNALAALPAHVAALKQTGMREGRRLRALINPMVICRPSEREAREYYEHIVHEADDEAVDGYFRHFALADSKAWGKHDRSGRIVGRIVGGNVQLVGDPQQVADGIEKLHRAGCDGVQLSFFDFKPDLEFFGEHVLPLLEAKGLRRRPASPD